MMSMTQLASRILVVALALSLSVGCKREASDEAEPKSAATQPDTPAVATTGKKEAEPKQEAKEEAAGDLPKLTRGELPADKIEASKKAESAGDKLFKSNDYEGATKEFERALKLDPGNLHAWYQMARVNVAQGKAKEGVALLQPLKEMGCPLCRERLLAAKVDAAFGDLKGDAAFSDLVEDAHKTLLKVDTAADRLESWFKKSGAAELPEEELIDPRSLVVLEDQTKDAKQRFVQLHGFDAFTKYLKENFPKGAQARGTRVCKNGCCDFKPVVRGGVLVEKFCFKTVGNAAVHLRKVVLGGKAPKRK